MSIRTRLASFLAAALLSVGAGIAVAPQATAAPYCGITWGSLAKASAPTSIATVRNVRAGQHACYDRLVIDLKGTSRTGYDVRYVSQVREVGSGRLVPLRGAARLQIIAKAPAYTSSGSATYRPARPSELVNVNAYRTFRQVAWAGSFEGQSTVGLGVRARLPFRTFTITDTAAGTTRIVIDVAHRW